MSSAQVLSKLKTMPTLFISFTHQPSRLPNTNQPLPPFQFSSSLQHLSPCHSLISQLSLPRWRQALIRALLKLLSEHSLPIPSYGGDETHFL